MEGGLWEVARVYLGDVTAICTYRWREGEAETQTYRERERVCVGSGGAISCYDAESGRLVAKDQVFTNGFRVHGVQASIDNRHLAVYGERSLKLYRLSSKQNGNEEEEDNEWQKNHEALRVVASVGPLAHWIMDAIFLPSRISEDAVYIALGLSNNTVQVFCIGKEGEVRGRRHYACLRECLLYSMKLYVSEEKEEEGEERESKLKVLVASGTIFNSVLVWEFLPNENETNQDGGGENEDSLCPATINFVGHEGSIHRLNWSSCGKLLASCSDDRTARVWHLTAAKSSSVQGAAKRSNAHDVHTEKREANKVFFGHQARLWDCLFTADSDFLVTASEDCTCKVWSLSEDDVGEGSSGLVSTLQGGAHVRGKGVWRIATIGGSLFTAGSDNAVKRWSLDQWCICPESVSTSLPSTNVESTAYILPRPPWTSNSEDSKAVVEDSHGKLPRSQEESKRMKEDREWVRCMKWVNHKMMYVATNQGLVYLLSVAKTSGAKKWHVVYAGQRRNVMVSLEVIFTGSKNAHNNHFVCVGDIYGYVSMISVLASDEDFESFKIGSCLEWQAHPGRRVLGIFKVRESSNPNKDLGKEQLSVFSTDSSGEVKWWKVPSGDLLVGEVQAAPLLLARLQSPLKRRIVCLDVSFASKLIICGDQNGSIMAFRYSQDQDPTKELELVVMLKNQHGVNAVTLLKLNDMNELISGGRDGKLFNYEIRSSGKTPPNTSLCPIGVHSVNNVAAIEDYIDLGDQVKLVAGFQATDFVVWNIVDDCQLIHSHCGGWRRPHSFLMDKAGKLNFAYLKDGTVFVQRLAQRDEAESKQRSLVDKDSNYSVFSNALAPTFHGCEIHSTKLLQSSYLDSEEQAYFAMTGSEDGCVRYSKWHFSREANAFRLDATGLVGEFIAGAAVRALSHCKCWNFQLGRPTNVYLTSVGAKEVVMVWNIFCDSATANGGKQNLRNKCIGMKIPKGGLRPKSYAKKDSMDLRHLAVDTFGVSTDDVDIIFMLFSSADATLTLAALEYNRLSGYTKWHEQVCDLVEGGQNPTLSIACKMFRWNEERRCDASEADPSSSTFMDNQRVVAFTGSTDGTLCCWDLSDVVKGFVRSLSSKADSFGSRKVRVVPLAKYKGVHASGVNSLEISIKRNTMVAPSGVFVCVVSGGDDQAIHVKDVLLVSNEVNGISNNPVLQIASCLDAHVANAHFSSLKGVWTNGNSVASTGIDQRLNLWRIERGSELHVLLRGSRCVEAGETESLDVAMHHAAAAADDDDADDDDDPICPIALGGRGLNLICVKKESVL